MSPAAAAYSQDLPVGERERHTHMHTHTQGGDQGKTLGKEQECAGM